MADVINWKIIKLTSLKLGILADMLNLKHFSDIAKVINPPLPINLLGDVRAKIQFYTLVQLALTLETIWDL